MQHSSSSLSLLSHASLEGSSTIPSHHHPPQQHLFPRHSIPHGDSAIWRDALIWKHRPENEHGGSYGAFSKLPRITAVNSRDDALIEVTVSYLAGLLHARRKTQERNLLWIDMQGIEEKDLAEIGKELDLHPLTVEDCMVHDTREKIERRGDYDFVVVSDASGDGGLDRPVNLNLIIFHDLLITVHSKYISSICTIVEQLDHCELYRIPSIEFIVYILSSRLLDRFNTYITQMKEEAEELDSLVIQMSEVDESRTNDLLLRLGKITNKTLSLLEGLVAKIDIFRSLANDTELFSQKGVRYIKNVHDQVLKMHINLSLSHELAVDANNLYMYKLQAQLTIVSNKVGVLMRRFAVINATFLPCSLIASAYGMNVLVPADAHVVQTYHAFIFVCITMIGIVLCQTIVFWRLKWW